MTHQHYPKPLVFSRHVGENIVLSDNGFLSEGHYLTAHGQFITHGFLGHNQTFGLEFQGTGIVKFTVFQLRRKAVRWVLSKQPLPKGCKRLKMKGVAKYNVVASGTDNCVRVESQLRPKTEVFIFDKGQDSTLAFDIECGDVVVNIFNTSSHITFDDCYHSPHIEIKTSQRMSSASLHHYNPSALCSLDKTPLKPGTILQLEVRHSGQSKDSGSYIRVCVSQTRSHYVNDELIPCSPSPTFPAFSGKRMCLVGGDSEVLQVTVVSDGLVLNRRNKMKTEKLTCPITASSTLWFELHKASLRAWQLLGYDIPNVTDAQTPTHEAPFSREPPLPPVCCRRTRKDALLDHVGYPEAASDEAYFGESPSCVGELNVDVLKNNYASYVSPDSMCTCRGSAPDPKCILNTTVPSSTQCDLSHLHVPTRVLNPIGPDVMTLTSLESNADSRIGDDNSLQHIHINSAGRETIYEKPDRIWLSNKNISGQLGCDSTFNNNKPVNMCNPKEISRYINLLSRKPQTTAHKSPNLESSSQRRMQNTLTGCSESEANIQFSNYVLKIKATTFLDSYSDDSKDKMQSQHLRVLHGCRTIQLNDSPAYLHTFQGPQSAINVHALHSNDIKIHAGDSSSGSVNRNNTFVDHSTFKHSMLPNLPRDNIASSNISNAAMVNFEVNTRQSVRDKTKFQKLSNSFRRRCIYMPKKPELYEVPPQETTDNSPEAATLGNTNSHPMEFHTKDSLIPVISEEHFNMDQLNFQKCNPSTAGTLDISHYLASLKLRQAGKSRSASNASDPLKKPAIRHSRSFSFFRLHSKAKTKCISVIPRPLSPVIPQ